MKLTKIAAKHPLPELNITSMIDVIFLLLIFFMCTTSFSTPEFLLPSQMPGQLSPQQPMPTFEPIQILFKSGENEILIYCDMQTCQNFDQLKEMLQQRKALGDIPVVISGDNDIPFGYMARALDLSYNSGFDKVGYTPAKENLKAD